MEGCSFKPLINQKSAAMVRMKRNLGSAVSIPDEFDKHRMSTDPDAFRSADEFFRAEEGFVKRKEMWREHKIRSSIQDLQTRVKSKKISKNSELILENSQR